MGSLRKRGIGAALCSLLPIAAAPPQASRPAAAPEAVIFNVTVLDGRGGLGRRRAVHIEDGKIKGLLPKGVRLPARVKRIDGKGGFLLPGFIDTHAHLLVPRCAEAPGGGPLFDREVSAQALSRLLDFGITFVRSPATPTVQGLKLRDDLNSGRLRGPKAVASAEFVNDSSLTDAQLRQYVRDALPHRPDFFKAYARLRPEQVKSLVEAAHAHGVPVIGHVQRTSWAEAIRLGIDQLTHAVDWSEMSLPPAARPAYSKAVTERGPIRARIDWLELMEMSSPEMQSLITALVQAQTPVDPTLVALDTKFSDPSSGRYRRSPHAKIVPALHRDWLECGSGITQGWTADDFRRWRAAWPKLLSYVRLLHEKGAVLTTGTDLTNPWVIPGESLHQEFELLAEAGIPPAAILRMSGEQAAKSVRRGDIGVIAPGKRADLVLLRKNPLADIRNTRSIVWVMQEGRLVSNGPPAQLTRGARSPLRRVE
jgi:imidazolonepropionase-like amidohydrolase